MKTKATDNVKLGFFVLAGVVFLILTLYMIGKNRNLFGNTFTIRASMSTVNGLTSGNNVRFKGINVGTVKDIILADDSSIMVVMVIDTKVKPYIRQNAIASIGTDGIMGNKLVNINSQATPAPPVVEGSIILSEDPIETDQMLRTLNTTNNTIERVTRNLDEITVKLNSSNSLWNLISDTVITQDLKAAVRDFRRTGSNTATLTDDAKDIVRRFSSGEGLAETLFTDTSLTASLGVSIKKFQTASEKAAVTMDSLESVIAGLKAGEGTVGLLLSDTLFRETMMQSALHLEQGTARFNENMEALRMHVLFRKYFRKMEKERQEELRKKNKNQIKPDTTTLTQRK